MPAKNHRAKKYTGQIIGVIEACELYASQIGKQIHYTGMSAMLLRLSKAGIVKQHFKGGYDRQEFQKELQEMKQRLEQTKPQWEHRPS